MKTMKMILVLVFCFGLVQMSFGQNKAPEVTNVTFNQRTDGSFTVDVYYDLNDADGDTMSVLMLASDDGGSSWNFSCESITGDFGRNILSGSGKHIVWDYGLEHPQTYGDQFRVEIYADDSNYEKGTVTDLDGNIYITTKIGDQWWMAENLKVTHYRNGDAIPNVTDSEEWISLSSGAYCSYDNADSNIATYGLLYNWWAVADSHNIAPAGWHVPSDDEWQVLVDYLGGDAVAGGKMKATGTIEGGDGLWQDPNDGATNESGFSALPGGYRYRSFGGGAFSYVAYFWSSTESSSYGAWDRSLYGDNSDASPSGRYRHGGSKRGGVSVRCVRD
jgi:uncharacterized protein (TIGR02145 family)